jgi:DNA-directed RNA polymerase II subunit RPB2
MERDAAISHGASAFLRERLMLVSDKYEAVFCKNCGIFAKNEQTGGYKCPLCDNVNNENFGKFIIPYAYKYLIHLLGGIGINLCPEFLTNAEYAERILKQDKYHPINTTDDINILTDYIEDKNIQSNE